MPRNNKNFLIAVVYFLVLLGPTSFVLAADQADAVPQKRTPILVNVQENLERLIMEEDTDSDKKITVDDTYVKGKGRGDKRFWLIATNGKRYEVDGTYYLSNLLQELSVKQRAGSEVAPIDFEMVFEKPVHRIRSDQQNDRVGRPICRSKRKVGNRRLLCLV